MEASSVYLIYTMSEEDPVAVCSSEEVATELIKYLEEESGRTHWLVKSEVCTNAPDFIDNW